MGKPAKRRKALSSAVGTNHATSIPWDKLTLAYIKSGAPMSNFATYIMWRGKQAFDDWSKVGLFGKIGDKPACFERRHLGKKRGTEILYLPSKETFERLDFVLYAAALGHSPERIRNAVESGLDLSHLPWCRNPRILGYVLTRPLAYLLNHRGRASEIWRRAQAIYKEFWTYDRREVHRLLKDNPPPLGVDPYAYLEGIEPGRDLIPLSIAIEPPKDASSYVDDIRRLDADELQQVVEAMRRIVNSLTDFEMPADHDVEILREHDVDGYDIVVEDVTRPGRRRDRIYRCEVDPSRLPMTMLKQSCSHLLSILRQADRFRWVRRCTRINFGRRRYCENYFAVLDSQEECGGRFCRLHNSAFDPTVSEISAHSG
jgi:hypothetical protein